MNETYIISSHFGIHKTHYQHLILISRVTIIKLTFEILVNVHSVNLGMNGLKRKITTDFFFDSNFLLR